MTQKSEQWELFLYVGQVKRSLWGKRDAKDGKIKEAVRRHGRGRLISESSCKETWDN